MIHWIDPVEKETELKLKITCKEKLNIFICSLDNMVDKAKLNEFMEKATSLETKVCFHRCIVTYYCLYGYSEH